MKDIIRAANKIMAVLPEGHQGSWMIVVHDTEAFKSLTDDEKEEARLHLEDLLKAKEGS